MAREMMGAETKQRAERGKATRTATATATDRAWGSARAATATATATDRAERALVRSTHMHVARHPRTYTAASNDSEEGTFRFRRGFASSTSQHAYACVVVLWSGWMDG
jgi:hypothetical protein